MGVIFLFSSDPTPFRVLPSRWQTGCLELGLGGLCQREVVGRISHVLEYAVLSALAARAVLWKKAVTWAGAGAAVLLSALYALLDEIHQTWVPVRTFQVLDLSLDGLGILLGAGWFAWRRQIAARITRSGRPDKSGV